MIYCEKMKLKPNKQLLDILEVNSNISRFTYNWLLSRTIEYFKKTKKKPTLKVIYDFQKEFRLIVKNSNVCDKNGEKYDKKFQDILKSAPSQISENECKNIFRAWSTLKKKDTPSFKKKKDSKQSFTLHKKVESTFKLHDNTLAVSKMKLKLNENRFLTSSNQIKLITISKSTYGWYASIVMEIDDDTFKIDKTNRVVGIDWGVNKFATDSDGEYVSFKETDGYNIYLTLEKKLKNLQRKLSKKRFINKNWKKSNRYLKLKFKITYLYEKLANIRKNFIHLVSKLYITEYDKIVIEDLKPSNLLKNHKLARSISMAMFYTWKITLQYKAKFYDKEVILVNPRNTSQNCSKCGEKRKEKLKLSNKIFNCFSCDNKLDRDYNAAINILKLA